MVAHLVVEQLELVLPFELGFHHLDADDRRHALARVLAGEVLFFFLDEPLLPGIVVDQRVTAVRMPVRCEPPSGVLIVLANAKTDSVKPSVYWTAASTCVLSTSMSM